MASDSPGTYGRCAHSSDSHDLSDLLQDTSCSRGNYQMNVVGGFQRDGLPIKDSGYYVNTSDGASTCSSSTTETGEIEGGTLLVLEPKSLRSFTTNDEYLYAMKEDLADWFACLYQRDDINADNFFHILETGVLLCRHANKVQEFARQRREMGETLEMRSYFIRSVPEGNVGYREAVKPETFQARDNVSNFISWGRQLGIPEVLSFETDDLVLRKNEKSVILCLLEIARVGAKLGMLAPTLIQMEQEIDAELAGEEPKPQIQIITCDMRSLDERVRDLIGRCTCPVQFPMIKVGEGKYKIGDSRSLIFVRILRNHVMVRVGGGWDTLENYLNKHDPCQCNYRGHRPSNAGLAHKVAFSQQRPPATPNNTVCRTTPNTPTSPRRGSTAAATAAADRHRSTSPQNSNTKAPTVIISRQMPTPSKRSTDAAGQSKGGRVLPTQSVASEDSLQPSSCLSSQQAGCKSANPARRRSISPQTSSLSSASSGLPLPKLVQQTSSNASPVKAKDLSHEHKMLTPKKNRNKLVDSDNDDNEAVDNDGYVAEDDECDNPHRPDHPGSESFDDKGNSDLSSSDLQHMRKSDTANPADGAEKSSMNIDKISTMTLAEFKSMLSSSLSVPEEQKQGSRELQEGRSSEQPQGMPSRSADPNHWNSLNQKASSGSDSALSDIYAKQIVGAGQGCNEESVFWINRPKAQKVLQRNAEESNTADILRPKTPTSLSRPKMSKPSAEIERTAPKEEYKMARPKPVSQIKRDAVAKVAGAISNWVESRNDADSTETLYRPKTPTRPKTLVGPHGSFHQDLLQEDDEGDHLEAVDTATSSLMQSLANASRDRPVTPSRIPKPSFIPRPKTPSSFTAEFPGEASSQSPLIPNLTRLNIALANRPAALSRSNSNSSSVKSVDETPVSPASSFSEDRMFKVHSRARRLSNSSDSFNAGNSAALTNSINSSASAALSSSTNTSGRSYKDIYVAKKAATDCRVPPTRAVTPGPREKWTLGGSSGASESQNPAPNTQRRRSINTVNKTDSQTLTKSTAPASPIRRTSSASNIEVEPMTITNEIAFSDDEEINEIIKNAALRIKKQTIRSSSVGARKYAHQHAKQNEEEVLMICRDQNMKDTVINNTASKYNIVRRPSSRGSSNGRGSPVTVVSRFSQAAGSSMHQQKTQPLHKSKKIDGRDSPVSSSQSAHKNMNRTEAWVDTTLADDKKKPVPPPKQVKAYMIAARELASRPLEEIQAILSEPKNGFVNVDARGLEAPAEDPAMYRKMEKLFEKYREMELKASMNEVLSHGGVRAAIKDKLADTQSTKSDSHRLVHGVSRPSMNVSSLKISSGAAVSAAGHSTGQNPAAPISCRTPSNDGNKLTKSSSTPFQNILHQTSTSNSPVMESSYQESKDYFNLDNSSETAKSKTPDPDSEHRGLGFLQDIDPELAKNPAALISKIKEILKVRPRKDENTKGPTRIPAPAKLNKRNRSKSVSNLYSDCMIDANSDSSHDLHESQPDGTSVFHNTESQSCYDDERSLKKSSNLVSEDVASSEDAPADTVPDLMSISVNFDSNDNQNRSETPLPKMATPLTTGRSTLISRKVDKFARNMSQDKENMSTSQSTISGLSVLTPTEDQVEFV